MNSNKKPDRETIILALALVKHLYNKKAIEYSCAAKPPIRQTGNCLSGLTETAYASLFA